MITNFIYKVVRRGSDGAWLPLCDDVADHIKYRLNEWTHPPEGWGPLAASNTLTDAVALALGMSVGAIHQLERIATSEIAILECRSRLWDGALPNYPGSALALWAKTDRGSMHRDMLSLPKGTVLCQALYPTEIVPISRISDLLLPCAFISGDQTPFVRAVPALAIGLARFAILTWPPYGETRDRFDRFLRLLVRQDPRLPQIVRKAFEMADQLAAANGLNQPRFLED